MSVVAATRRADAKRLGLKRYSTGRPCGRGHVGERYASTGQCVNCVTEFGARQQADGYWLNHYQNNKVEICAYQRELYSKDPKTRIENAKRWVTSNPEARAVISKNYKHRRRIREGGSLSTAALREWTEKQTKICYWCGAPCAADFHVDHYHPLAKGGVHQTENLVIACAPCNLSKSARDPYEFANLRGRLF